jgi:hypothetical protein
MKAEAESNTKEKKRKGGEGLGGGWLEMSSQYWVESSMGPKRLREADCRRPPIFFYIPFFPFIFYLCFKADFSLPPLDIYPQLATFIITHQGLNHF